MTAPVAEEAEVFGDEVFPAELQEDHDRAKHDVPDAPHHHRNVGDVGEEADLDHFLFFWEK